MKTFALVLVFTVFLAIVSGEIVPRFPGVQPIVINATATSTTPVTQFEVKSVIDPFTRVTDPQLIIILEQTAPPTVTQTAFDIDNSILGGERDIVYTATTGNPGAVFSAGAANFQGENFFSVSTIGTGSGVCEVQYDGRDSSLILDSSVGLRGVDLTNRNGNAISLVATTDLPSSITIVVYDNIGRSASYTRDITSGTNTYVFSFSQFQGVVSFSNVNAIVLRVQANRAVDIAIFDFNVVGAVVEAVSDNCFTGVVLPCDTDYYRLEVPENINVGDYVVIEYSASGEISNFDTTTGHFYLVSSTYSDLQTELATNENIVDTLGELPGPDNYNYTCTDDCTIEIVWSVLQNTTYYIAVEGKGVGNLVYQVCYAYRSVPVFQLLDNVQQPVFRDQVLTSPPDDRARAYRYYVIDVPQIRYSEGTYLIVNISRAEPFPGLWMGLMYESLPAKAIDTGILGQSDFDSEGNQVDDVVYPFCVNVTARPAAFPNYDHPIRSDVREPCSCFTQVQTFGAGPNFQLTCELVVDPCQFKYGNWYIGVELPTRAAPFDAFDPTGFANYTIGAKVMQPLLVNVNRNVTYKSFVEPEAATHFKIEVPESDISSGNSHMIVQISNVRNGVVNVFVHKGTDETNTLAGGREACVPANATCTTSDACNIVIDKCHFSAGNWYVSVEIVYNSTTGFSVFDFARLPITYTLRANWDEESVPENLIAGVPVSKYIGSGLYDFYVIDVPPTIDTWLFVELFAKAEDTEVIIAMLHGDLPGGDCYARPDFYCMTGDPSETRVSTGPPTFLNNAPIQRESCTFMIQTCELQAGPLFISVYGHHKGYATYGDNTYYQVPAHYTLWADFDVALAVQSGVSYSETVFEKQYQHYYIRADRVFQGSSLSVEITNIQHGIPQTIEAFINYNYLAGDCPCYENLYNCTSNSACAANRPAGIAPVFNPDTETVLNCCTMIVPASDFRPGVWYIAVLGVNEDLFQYTTPIGYTITTTIHDAPTFNPLLLGQTYTGEVPQYNKTLEYAHFRLGAAAIPSNDLIFKVTFVQNCEFLGKHDDSTDQLIMYVNRGAPANQYLGGYDYRCIANTTTDSYCTIVVPSCEWEGNDYFVAIQGDYDAVFTGRFTLRAFTDEVRDYQLTDGVAHYDRVAEGRYKHFFITTTAQEDQYLAIDIYTNQDQDSITAYLNKDVRAGDAPCFTNMDVCETESMCSWQLLACEMTPGRYYISVYGQPGQFYDTSVEFTITASIKPVATRLFNGSPVTGHIPVASQVQHYYLEVADFRNGSFITFTVDNVKHGEITAYGQYGFLAGRCPCYIHEYTCTAIGNPIGSSDETNEWCEIRIPICDLQEGKYFFSIYATETLSPASMAFGSPIGFTVEANLVSPITVRPTVVVDRIVANTEPNQFVANERYNHFAFSWDDDDFSQGYHIIVEITSVRDGALNVFYSKGRPGDADEDCHIAQICTSGLGAGTECFWQIPYCLSKPVNGTDGQSQTHYISIEGITGRIQASYNILIYKQNVPTVVQNTFFTLDGPPADSTVFPLGAELNITHSKVHEPNGWTQFIRLLNVPAHADTGRGQMLELFFYRITNNLDQPLDFNVYVHPKEPAGAHECCSEQSELGSCQGAPCSNSADTTVSINNSDDVFSHTCSFGFDGVGDNGDGDAFFGQRCTVRVWPCEFNKYCGNETIDWFVSVVPLATTDPASNGVGLSYSLQWRSRDIRLMSSGGVGSVDLNPIINNYEFSEVYNVEFIDTESEGWLSYHVDWNNAYGRLSVQTLFSGPDGNPAGSGAVVYIQGDEFASDTTSCYDYICSAGEDCAGASRFYVSESCSDKFTRYYITVRNTGIGSNSVSVQFRIVSTILPAAVEIPSHPSPSNVYVATSGNNVYGFNGVEGDNYDFYYLILDDDDLDGHQSWVIDISRPEDDLSSSPLEVYIRFGAEPGQYGVDNAQAYYGDFVEGSHAWQYQCTLPSAGARCQYQIQACDLIEGFWYISIHNPDFTFDSTPQALPQYTLRTYVDSPPLEVGLNQQVYVNRESDYFGLLQHFSVNVTVDALDFDDRTDITGYWTKYLRFQLDGITVDGNVVNGDNLGSVTLFVNYGDVAGPVGENSCLDNFASTVCNSGSCFVDVTPCQYESENGKNIKLVTGVYYVSVIQDVPSDYAFTARVYRNEYIPLAITDTLTGTGNEEGTTIERIVYTVTAGEVQIDGDGAGNYRYVIDDVHGVNDDLDDNEYFLFNISTSATTDNGDSLEMEVWRDDCTRFSCSVTGPNSWCVIDALTLSPATAKNGRFFIRVENPEGAVFTITYWHKEAIVQNLLDGQKLTEVVYPYQYQEYYYVAQEVGEGATLTVNVCVTCGDVEVYIRPDLPAGPYDIDQPQIRSAIDSCIARSSEALEDEDDYGCCTIFLDTCEYEQRGYYIGIRGVETVYPGEGNENLYLPAKYNIEAFQTIVRVEPLNVGCFGLVTYEEEYSIVPKQYAVDIETISVGTQVRVSIRGPPNYEDFVGLRTTFNYTDGYTGSCPSSDYSCSDVGSCAFIIPYCAFAVTGGQRIYMYADAPRGSEILVERWEPSIPIIHPNVMYSDSINGPEDETVFASLPFRPNEQYYRIDLNPWGDETYYEHFFVRVQLQNVTQGTVSLAVNTGNYPTFGDSCGDEPTYLAVVESESELSYIDIHYDQLKALFPAPEDDDDSGIRTPRTFPLNGDDSNNDDDDEDSYLPRTFWITVRGTEQTCELHAIKYSLVVKTNWVVTYFPIGETICDSVSDGEYNFHRLKPHQVEHPQQSILHFRVTDLSEDASLNLLINDEHLATSESLDGLATFSADSPNDFEWICGYESLYFSVTPSEDSETVGATDYNLHVQKEKVHVKELFNDKIYYHDDDDDDACAHEHDFYIYRTAQPRGNHAGAFFRVLVDSEFPTEVYVNKDTFAWGPCHDSGYGSNDPEATGTTSVNVYDFCDFADGTYYITVVSNGPYYIYTNVRDDAKNLTIGQVFRDELEPAMYQVYTLEVCADWFEADDRLVVELSDVQNGDVFGYIRYAGNPGDRTSEDGAVSCAEDSVVAEFGAGESGYNYLLVNSCDLKAGTYHILIRASPHEGSPVRNCQHVTYRLFPYFIDYQIEPTKIAINTPVTDSVDFYTVNRIDETTVPFTRYYSFVPGQGDGFKDGVSQAVVRLSNVDGGLVTVRVMSGHLAVSEFGYISGETYGLAHSGELNPEWHMQSTARPFTQQRILDSRQSVYHPECDGCSDFCASTFYADIEESDTYTADKSLAVWIPSCYLSIETVYIAVEANRQNYQDRSISYELTVENTRDYVLIQPNTNKVATFSNDNWDYDFYYSISAEPESMRWRVVVTGGEGVLVTVRNHRCPLQATWIKEVWCDADYFDRPWLCDIEIPTRASHPGDNAFFVAVNGKNATYSIAFWRGRENCHDFTGSGRSDGLSFCAGLVPYATWRWDSYSTLDNEAECFFEELYSQFRVQPCWSGVTAECNATLAAFACYESFHRCDADGFAVGTCRESCDAVVYECSNMFESVNLEHYNCSSSRYVDGHAGTCSGNSQFASFNAQNNLFVDVADPDLILFKSSPAIGVSASSTVTYSFVLSIIAVVFALLI